MAHSKKTFTPRIAVKGLQIASIRVPEGAIFMRTNDGYIWTSDVYAVKNFGHFSAYSLRVNDKYPKRITISTDSRIGKIFQNFAKTVKIGFNTKPEIFNRDLLGLKPNNRLTTEYKRIQIFAKA